MTDEGTDVQVNLGTETTWTPMRTTLNELIEKLDLKNAILVGHSTGGGEVARYMVATEAKEWQKLCYRRGSAYNG